MDGPRRRNKVNYRIDDNAPTTVRGRPAKDEDSDFARDGSSSSDEEDGGGKLEGEGAKAEQQGKRVKKEKVRRHWGRGEL